MGSGFKFLAATAFGLGLMPLAPGTFGTLLGVVVHAAAVIVFPKESAVFIIGAFFILSCAGSLWLLPWSRVRFGDSDPKEFVIDEVAGYLLVPLGVYLLQACGVLCEMPLVRLLVPAFLLFRLFDAAKPPPAYQIDRRMHTALGVLLDDLVAGIYAILVIYLIQDILPVCLP